MSETDAANFENSNTLEEFLEKYGVLGELGTGDTILVNNPEYETAMDQYEEDMANYNEEYIKYEQEIADWQSREPSLDDPKYQIPDPDWVPPVVGDDDDDVETWSLYEAFTEGTAGGCYTTFMNQCGKGYLNPVHACDVLEHMLELGKHTTSNGEVFEIFSKGTDYESHWWTGTNQDQSIDNVGGDPKILEQIRKAIEGQYACGQTQCDEGGTHYMDCPTDWDGCGGRHEMSCDTIDDCDGSMLLVDKIEDLYYEFKKLILENDRYYTMDLSNPEEQDLYNQMVHLVEHDLKGVIGEIEIPKEPEEVPEAPMIPDEEAYNADHDAWELEGEAIKPPTLPPEVTVPQYLEEEVRKIEDLDKAQWYVNLWHRMNGTSDFKAGFGNSEDYIAGNGWASKSETDQNWAVLKDGDMHSPEYLKYAIENGLITIEQVQFTDPSESGTGIENAVWTSIVFSSAQDITEQKDQVAITIAETEYNQTLREIEAKDKEYDTQIKKLDTEHNALQTEYDSIKSVIEKNVERSFKIFS